MMNPLRRGFRLRSNGWNPFSLGTNEQPPGMLKACRGAFVLVREVPYAGQMRRIPVLQLKVSRPLVIVALDEKYPRVTILSSRSGIEEETANREVRSAATS
jgi:hypothetical protein